MQRTRTTLRTTVCFLQSLSTPLLNRPFKPSFTTTTCAPTLTPNRSTHKKTVCTMPDTASTTPSSTPNLGTILSQTKNQMMARFPPEMIAKMDTIVANLNARYQPSPPPKGTIAPTFELSNAVGKKVALSDLLNKHKAVVLTWYRGNWCPYCNLALRAMMQANDEIEALGAKLVCLSGETPDESLSTVEKNELKVEVLSDDGLQVAEKFGIAYGIEGELEELYDSFGLRMKEMNGNAGVRKPKLPVPATFVLDGEGKVVYSYVEMDHSQRAEPADVIEAIKAVVAQK